MRSISPSLVSADLANLAGAVKSVVEAGADRLHLDVEDGVFVPNLTFGFPILRAVRPLSNLPLELHLMMHDPEPYIARFADLGADIIAVHWEALPYPRRVLGAIRARGCRAYLAFNPRTPLADAAYVTDLLDGFLLMSSEPDGQGDQFLPSAVERVRAARALDAEADIVVDGGITPAVAALLWAAGATTLVVGRAVFGAADLRAAIRAIRQA